MTMSEPQQWSASLARDAVYKTGLRSFMEYRDLGIEQATHGPFRAHVIRTKKEAHKELDSLDNVEVLEVYSPAVHRTGVVGSTAAVAYQG
jgi:hypothetical protein